MNRHFVVDTVVTQEQGVLEFHQSHPPSVRKLRERRSKGVAMVVGSKGGVELVSACTATVAGPLGLYPD